MYLFILFLSKKKHSKPRGGEMDMISDATAYSTVQIQYLHSIKEKVEIAGRYLPFINSAYCALSIHIITTAGE